MALKHYAIPLGGGIGDELTIVGVGGRDSNISLSEDAIYTGYVTNGGYLDFSSSTMSNYGGTFIKNLGWKYCDIKPSTNTGTSYAIYGWDSDGNKTIVLTANVGVAQSNIDISSYEYLFFIVTNPPADTRNINAVRFHK